VPEQSDRQITLQIPFAMVLDDGNRLARHSFANTVGWRSFQELRAAPESIVVLECTVRLMKFVYLKECNDGNHSNGSQEYGNEQFVVV
jgi:hypothetical protein